MIWGYPYSWKHQYSQGGKQFKTASQPIGLFSRVAEVQQGNESRSYAKETHRQKGIDARWCKCSNFWEMKCDCLAEAYCSLGISQTCTRLMEEHVSLCFIVVEAGICCSMHRILCFETKYESKSWIISERQKRQLLRVGSTSKWKRQSLQRWWYVEWHAFLAVLIAPFFVLKTESRSQRNIHGAAFIAICQSLDMQSSILPWDLDYGFWKTTKMEGL